MRSELYTAVAAGSVELHEERVVLRQSSVKGGGRELQDPVSIIGECRLVCSGGETTEQEGGREERGAHL